MISDAAGKYYDRFKANLALADAMESQFPGHGGWA